MHSHLSLVACLPLAYAAALATAPVSNTVDDRAIPILGRLTDALLGPIGDAVSAGDSSLVSALLSNLTPKAIPTSVSDATAVLQSLSASATSMNVVDYGAQLILNGIYKGPLGDLVNYSEGLASAEAGSNNVNPAAPRSIYPKAKSCDAPYTTEESKLRSAIYIPPTFTYGEKRPLVLMGGTGSTGYISFSGNLIPLLKDVDYADIVWINNPDFLLSDAQVNAEYLAYAVNYVAAITNRNDTGVIAWSQGNIDSQWAYKYWPSTREIVTDHIAISADYEGSIFANALNLLVPGLTNVPAILQQRYQSNFILNLREGGGNSTLVPTTSVYSGFFDEIVQPQSGTSASAYLEGAENVEVQTVCSGKGLAGTFYTHESLLVNPLTFALIHDALTNDGPGRVSRIESQLDSICEPYLTPGLGLDDLLITESSNIVFLLTTLAYPKVASEPEIRSYAVSGAQLSC